MELPVDLEPFSGLTRLRISSNLHRTRGGQVGLARRAKPIDAAGKCRGGVLFLARILRFLLVLVVLSWAVWLVRRLFAHLSMPSARRETRPETPVIARRLYRDPSCGTHVSDELSYSLEEAGQVLHFCSTECRERYRASLRRAAGG